MKISSDENIVLDSDRVEVQKISVYGQAIFDDEIILGGPVNQWVAADGSYQSLPVYATRWPAWGEVTAKPYFYAMAFEPDAPNNSLYYARRNNAWYAMGSAAQYNIGTSGGTVPRCNTANTWSAKQTYSVDIELPGTTDQYVRGDGSRAAMPDVADFRPAVAWVFDGNDRGWPASAGGATVTFAAANNSTLSGALHWLATSGDSYIYSPPFAAISGAENYSVFIKLKASNPTAYQGQLYWTDDAGHGPGTTQSGTCSLRNTTDWQIVEIDMRQFTGGTYSWINSNVTQIRIDGPNYNGTWDIAWVAIGRPSTPPICSTKITNIEVVSSVPSSDPDKDGTLYLVF